jgi:hypothetical protein
MRRHADFVLREGSFGLRGEQGRDQRYRTLLPLWLRHALARGGQHGGLAGAKPQPNETCESWPEQITIGCSGRDPQENPARPATAGMRGDPADETPRFGSSTLAVKLDSTVTIIPRQGL